MSTRRVALAAGTAVFLLVGGVLAHSADQILRANFCPVRQMNLKPRAADPDNDIAFVPGAWFKVYRILKRGLGQFFMLISERTNLLFQDRQILFIGFLNFFPFRQYFPILTLLARILNQFVYNRRRVRVHCVSHFLVP